MGLRNDYRRQSEVSFLCTKIYENECFIDEPGNHDCLMQERCGFYAIGLIHPSTHLQRGWWLSFDARLTLYCQLRLKMRILMHEKAENRCKLGPYKDGHSSEENGISGAGNFAPDP